MELFPAGQHVFGRSEKLINQQVVKRFIEMRVQELMQNFRRPSEVRSAETTASETIRLNNGNLTAVLYSIVNDRHAPGARQDKLKMMVDHSSEFRRYLGINDSGILERMQHGSETFKVRNQVIAPQVLAEVAALPVKEEYASRALDRLEKLFEKDMQLDNKSRLKFQEAAAEGFVCLAKNLSAMPSALAHRAIDIINNEAMFFEVKDKLRVYKACSELPDTGDKKIDDLISSAKQKEQKARSSMAASADNSARTRLLAAVPGKWEGFPEICQQIFKEAERRGITVKITSKSKMRYTLSHGGKEYDCCYSQTPLTPPSAIELCGDKMATSKFLKSKGIPVPAQMVFTGDVEAALHFLNNCPSGSVVVKPSHGCSGKGVSVGVTEKDLQAAIAYASKAAPASAKTLIEECHKGEDLRLLVINYELVAAARRKPAEVEGDGTSTIRSLIQNKRIQIDEETERCLQMESDAAGNPLSYDSVLESGRKLQVRRNANTSTGGTIEDITPVLDPKLRDAAVAAAREMQIPVVGFDFLVESPDKYVVIEANEAPSLANHDPQPVVQRFIDLLFPHS